MDNQINFVPPAQDKDQTPVPTPPYKSPVHWLVVVVVIFAVMVFIVISYFNTLWPFSDLLPVIPTLTPELIQEIDDTSTWQTYRNEEYGFEFMYPEQWVVSDSLIGAESFSVFLKDSIQESNSGDFEKPGMIISSQPKLGVDYLEYPSFSKNTDIINYTISLKYEINSTFIYSTCTNGQTTLFDICDQILSTFRFVDSQ